MPRKASAALVENPGFDSQHPNGDSKLSVTPAPGIQVLMWCTDVDAGRICTSREPGDSCLGTLWTLTSVQFLIYENGGVAACLGL